MHFKAHNQPGVGLSGAFISYENQGVALKNPCVGNASTRDVMKKK